VELADILVKHGVPKKEIYMRIAKMLPSAEK